MPELTPAALDALASQIPLAQAAPPLAITAQADGGASISLDGVVGWDFTAASIRRALGEVGDRDVTVSINSPGGSVFEGFAIYNQLARHKGRVTTLVDGLAASMGSVIILAGATRIAARASFVMIHNASTLAWGDYREMDRTSAVLKQVTDAINGIYVSRTGQEQGEMQALMDAETWFGPDDALAHGFVTGIEGDAEARAPAGRAAELVASFTRAPDAVRRLFPVLALGQVPTPRATPAQPQEGRVPETNPTPGNPPANPPQPAAPVAATIAQLRAIAAAAPTVLTDAWVLDQAAAGVTEAAARDAGFNALAAAQPPRGPTAVITRDERETFQARASAAMSARFAGQAPSEEGREYYSLGLQGLIQECLHVAGVAGAYRLRGEGLYDRLRGEHTTSDFPLILRNAANKRLMDRFRTFPATWRTWVEESDVNDFKDISVADVGTFPPMSDKPESASVRYGAVSEDGYTYRISTKSSGVVLSREAIINDDMRAFGRMLNDAAQAGYNSVSDAVYNRLKANPVQQDGVALFHATHKNLATGSDLDETNLGIAEQLLMEQTDGSGQTIAPPQRLVVLVPPALNIKARKLATVVTPDSQANVGVYGGRIVPVVEPRLAAAGDPWYLVTPDRPTMEVSYLAGRREPQLSSMEDFDTLGMKYRLIFDFAAHELSWRGMVKNPG